MSSQQPDVAAYCGGAGYAMVTPPRCAPTMRPSDVCEACPYMNHARLGMWDGNCSYVCDTGYFLSSGSCAPCLATTSCPIGSYLDISACMSTQVRTANPKPFHKPTVSRCSRN